MSTDLSRLDAHLTELCAQHRICREVSARKGRAYRRARLIRIPPLRSVLVYWVGLHEIGHVVGRGRSAPRLEAEANAWLWALENAIVEPSPATRQRIGKYLHSYLLWAQNRQYRKVPPRIPDPDHPFWTLHAWY